MIHAAIISCDHIIVVLSNIFSDWLRDNALDFVCDYAMNVLLQTTVGVTNGFDSITQGVGELQFEEDEEDAFCMKDLPKHACA